MNIGEVIESGGKIMRVAFITSVISKRLGGIQNTGYYFAKCFPKSVDFSVFCSTESELDDVGCTVCKSQYKSNDTRHYHFDLLKMLFSQNRIDRFDFTFASLYPMALECYLLKKIKKIPYGVMMHGNELMDGVQSHLIVGRIIQKVRFFIRSIILNNADVLFANSEFTKSLCKSKFKNKNIQVIHPPICFEDKNILNSEKTNVIFSLGRIEKRKGFQFVVEAMEEMIKTIPNLKYYIAGAGPYEKRIKEIIEEKNLQDNVIMLGRVSEDEKDFYYRLCDFFIMPSFVVEEESSVEGFGIVFIEANMYGKYVITTQSGGIPDAVIPGVTGDFVETEDSNSICAMLNKLYSQEFSYDSEKCIEWAKQMDISNIVNQYTNCISHLLQSR